MEFNYLEMPVSELTTTPSGLTYEDIAVGDGPTAGSGQKARVHYTGWLKSGEKFDSSRDRNDPFEFTLGAGQVIKGWDEGVTGMKVGGKRKLTIPASLGYGSRGAGGVIPPNAELIFEVELLNLR
jgi:FKBP-type peptidyl-prolyl cis-trans isomerase